MPKKKLKNEDRAARLLAAVRKHGSDARDARDAAHEACHALDAKLKGKWTRDNIHEGIEELAAGDRGVMLYYEIRARAVEMLVCQDLDIEYDLEEWTHTCFMEQVTVARIVPPSYEWLLERIKAAAGMLKTRLQVKRLLALR